MKVFTKIILLSISIILINIGTSYAKKTIITVEKDLRKIQITNYKGYIVKTYYEKFSIKFGWLEAICKKEEVNLDNFFEIILNCNFAPNSLKLINNQRNNNENRKVASKNLNNNTQQEEAKQTEAQQTEAQQTENQEEQEQLEENNLPLDPPIGECNDSSTC